MGRWQMCSRCGVKLIQDVHTLEVVNDEAEIRSCPICKRSTLTIRGKLLKEVEEVAEKREMTTEEVLQEAIKRLELVIPDVEP